MRMSFRQLYRAFVTTASTLTLATAVLTSLVSQTGCGGTSEPGIAVDSASDSEMSESSARQPAAEAELPEATVEPVASRPPLPKPLSAELLAAGWVALFDGETLFGWEKGSDANWRVESGVIAVDGGERGLLCTTAEFANYELHVEFRSAKGTNSGVFLRTPLVTSPDDITTKCYELNIADSDNPFPTGSLVKRAKAEGNFDSDDWQTFDVTVDGGQVNVKLDGAEILTYTDPNPVGRGRIGLQLNEGLVEFRNVRLRPLGATSIFNGQDLSGWKTYPEMASRFTVNEQGELHVADGRGHLETENSYGDFVLQFECKTHAPNLNSGVFYRCIPGETMNGYEAQIHNGTKEGDPWKPLDCGTGGIFRRQDARFVFAVDQQWFSMTVVATGPHVSTWVNGIQVADWTDTRPP
ncbi:MAG: DUF1080 domain-containing protein, partial [Planctomycetales bacterium]|nr:DUF1080 domain-containing protein [Planctomycetales bacterium]